MFIICRPYFKLPKSSKDEDSYFIGDALNYKDVDIEIIKELKKVFPEPQREIKRLGETNIYKIDVLHLEIMRGSDTSDKMLNYFRLLAGISGASINVKLDEFAPPYDCKLYIDSFNDNEVIEGFTDDYIADNGKQEHVGKEEHLTDMELEGLILNNTTIVGMSFARSNLTNSLFEKCTLICTDFTGAVLYNCNFDGSDIRGSLFNNSNMRTITAAGIWTMIIDCTAGFCDFSGAEMQYCYLRDSDYTESKFISTNLYGAKMESITALEANFENATLSGTDLFGASLPYVNLTNAKLNNSNLDSVELSSSILNGTDFSSSQLTGAQIDNTILIRANLTNCDLSSSKLRDSDLTDAILINADLTDANLSRSTLTRANLTNARLYNTNLEQAVLQDAIYGDNINNAVFEETIIQPYEGIGPAFEIHNAFNKIDMGKYMSLIETENKKDEQFKQIDFNKDNIIPYINGKFIPYIEKSKKIEEVKKSELKDMLKKNLDKLISGPEITTDTATKLGQTIMFVFNQDDAIINYYVSHVISDTYYAYKDNDEGECQSCIDGILERFITVLGNAIGIFCLNKKNECNEVQIKVANVVNDIIDVQELIKEWVQKNDDEERVYSEMSKEERKQDFIGFLTRNKAAQNDIDEIVKQFESIDFFENKEKSFGGKKIYKHKSLNFWEKGPYYTINTKTNKKIKKRKTIKKANNKMYRKTIKKINSKKHKNTNKKRKTVKKINNKNNKKHKTTNKKRKTN